MFLQISFLIKVKIRIIFKCTRLFELVDIKNGCRNSFYFHRTKSQSDIKVPNIISNIIQYSIIFNECAVFETPRAQTQVVLQILSKSRRADVSSVFHPQCHNRALPCTTAVDLYTFRARKLQELKRGKICTNRS